MPIYRGNFEKKYLFIFLKDIFKIKFVLFLINVDKYGLLIKKIMKYNFPIGRVVLSLYIKGIFGNKILPLHIEGMLIITYYLPRKITTPHFIHTHIYMLTLTKYIYFPSVR